MMIINLVLFVKYRFPIDRNVLSAASEYIAASLGSNFQENRKSEFVLNGADGETVKTIVDYCYTGKINLDGENVGRFLAIASSYELDLLERKCRRYYERNLSLNNCVEALMIADKYSHADLRQKALKFVSGSFENVPATDVHKLDPRIFQDLLKSEKIQATEELVFTRLMEWFHSNEVDHKTFMSQLLKLIRLDLMTEKVLSTTDIYDVLCTDRTIHFISSFSKAAHLRWFTDGSRAPNCYSLK